MSVALRDPGPLVTQADSLQRGWHAVRSMRNMLEADVTHWSDGEIAIHVNANGRHSKITEWLASDMVYYPWPAFCPQVLRTEIHVECYRSNRNSRPVLRVIRKGIPKQPRPGHFLLAEWFLRISRNPITFYLRDDPNGPEELVSQKFLETLSRDYPAHTVLHADRLCKPPTAAEFYRFAARAHTKSIDIPGARVRFDHLHMMNAKLAGGAVLN